MVCWLTCSTHGGSKEGKSTRWRKYSGPEIEIMGRGTLLHVFQFLRYLEHCRFVSSGAVPSSSSIFVMLGTKTQTRIGEDSALDRRERSRGQLCVYVSPQPSRRCEQHDVGELLMGCFFSFSSDGEIDSSMPVQIIPPRNMMPVPCPGSHGEHHRSQKL